MRVYVFVAAVVCVLLLEALLNWTWFGRSIRALMQNPYAGRIVGVDDHKLAAITFGLGIGFAGVAGALLARLYSFQPDFGRPFLIRAFVIIVLGGLESISGVALGALVLALVETFSILFVPASYQPAISFGLLVLVLIVLPGGIASLLGRRMRRARMNISRHRSAHAWALCWSPSPRLAAHFPACNPTRARLLFITFVWVTASVAWNLLGGFAGQVSFGFAVFYGIGAYVAAMLIDAGRLQPVPRPARGAAWPLPSLPCSSACRHSACADPTSPLPPSASAKPCASSPATWNHRRRQRLSHHRTPSLSPD